MSIQYNNRTLHKLEDLMSETDYVLRYEKGNFKSGYCILNDSNIAVVNKYYTLEGKISCLVDIVKQINIDSRKLSEKNRAFYQQLLQTQLEV